MKDPTVFLLSLFPIHPLAFSKLNLPKPVLPSCLVPPSGASDGLLYVKSFSAWLVWTPVAWSPRHSPSSTHSRPCPCGASAQSMLSQPLAVPFCPNSQGLPLLVHPGIGHYVCQAPASCCGAELHRTWFLSALEELSELLPPQNLWTHFSPTAGSTEKLPQHNWALVCRQILWTGIRTLQPTLTLIKGLKGFSFWTHCDFWFCNEMLLALGKSFLVSILNPSYLLRTSFLKSYSSWL